MSFFGSSQGSQAQLDALRTKSDGLRAQIAEFAADAELGRRMRVAMHEMTTTRPNGIAKSSARSELTPASKGAPPTQVLSLVASSKKGVSMREVATWWSGWWR